MELTKVLEVYNHKGDLWYIHPYIESGKIVRKAVFKTKNGGRYYEGWGCYTFLEPWGKGKYYSGKGKVTDETELNNGVRVFTTRPEALKALEDFERQHAYKISESVKKAIESLERQRENIDAQIAKLKETGEKAFKNLSTTFSK
jgi:hypothetical protein